MELPQVIWINSEKKLKNIDTLLKRSAYALIVIVLGGYVLGKVFTFISDEWHSYKRKIAAEQKREWIKRGCEIYLPKVDKIKEHYKNTPSDKFPKIYGRWVGSMEKYYHECKNLSIWNFSNMSYDLNLFGYGENIPRWHTGEIEKALNDPNSEVSNILREVKEYVPLSELNKPGFEYMWSDLEKM